MSARSRRGSGGPRLFATGSPGGLLIRGSLGVAFAAAVAWLVVTTVRVVVVVVVRVLWLTGRLVTGLVTQAPVTLAVAAAAAGLWWATDWQRLAMAVAVVLVALLVWRLAWPGSFRRLIAASWAGYWRRWAWYQWRWGFLAARHGLAARTAWSQGWATGTVTVSTSNTPGRVRTRPVRLLRVVITPGVHRLLLYLPAGLDDTTVSAARPALAHALHTTGVRVRTARPGRIWLDIRRRDTLAAPIRPLPIPHATTPETVTELLGGVPLGRCEDGTTWRLRLSGTHVLLAGATGAGKGSVLWSIVRALSGAIAAGLVELVVLDPKGGMEFRPGQALFAALHADDPASMADALDDLVADMNHRATALAGNARVHTPAPGSPHRVVLIDELAAITALADNKTAKRVEHALGLLLSKARATGITVVASVIDPAKDVTRWRHLFPTRIALRLNEPIQVDMVLGPGSHTRGADCEAIPLTTPGVGFVRLDADPDPVRVRASYLSDDDITALTTGEPTDGDPAGGPGNTDGGDLGGGTGPATDPDPGPASGSDSGGGHGGDDRPNPASGAVLTGAAGDGGRS